MQRTPRQTSGFTFLELLVVMGIMAVLMGMTVGYLQQIGEATQADQARAILVETVQRCQTASIGGGRRADLTLTRRPLPNGGTVLEVGASIAQPVLTHQFEELDAASGNMQGRPTGIVLAKGLGWTGSAARFERGGTLEYGPQSAFAMTEGFELDVRIKPTLGAQRMVLVEGADEAGRSIYRVSLVRSTAGPDLYEVELSLLLRRPGEDVSFDPTGLPLVAETQGGAVRTGGAWQHVEVSWHGMAPSIRVNGLERYEQGKARVRRGASLDAEDAKSVSRLAVPRSGVLKLLVSHPASPFQGLMDVLQVRGVFRSDEMQRRLPETLDLISPSLPVRLAFVNGGLDPVVHKGPVVLEFSDQQRPDDLPLALHIGMNGTVESRLESATRQGVPGARRAAPPLGGDGP